MKHSLLHYLLPELKYVLIGVPIYLLIFFIYLELSPSLGNVWLRYNECGKLKINISSFLQFLSLPLRSSFVWRPEFWDLNVFIGGYVSSIMVKVIYEFDYTNK